MATTATFSACRIVREINDDFMNQQHGQWTQKNRHYKTYNTMQQ